MLYPKPCYTEPCYKEVVVYHGDSNEILLHVFMEKKKNYQDAFCIPGIPKYWDR